MADLLARCLADLHAQRPVQLPAEIDAVAIPAAPTSPAVATLEPVQLPASKQPASAQRQWFTTAAMALLLLFAALALTEAYGVTNVRGTVIRLFSPDGTLVVEVDDPEVSISIDGEEMVITGAGAKEIRLQPGQYQVQATKDGKLLTQELVTVTKNGRQVVRVSREALPEVPRGREVPAPSAALAALRREDIPAEALAYAGGGDPTKAPATLVAVVGNPTPIHTAALASLAFSADGRWLASGSADRTILVRDAANGKVLRVFRGHEASVTCVAILPDGETLVSGDFNSVVKLSLGPGNIVARFSRCGNAAQCVELDRSQQTAAGPVLSGARFLAFGWRTGCDKMGV